MHRQVPWASLVWGDPSTCAEDIVEVPVQVPVFEDGVFKRLRTEYRSVKETRCDFYCARNVFQTPWDAADKNVFT